MERKPTLPLLLLGATAGLLAGLLGIGGGLLVGPILMLMGFSLKRAFGSALAVVLAAASVAVVTELLLAPGNFHWWVAAAVAFGGQIGAQVAGRWIKRVSEHHLRWAFLLLVLYASLRNLGILGTVPGEALPGIANGALAIEIMLCLALGFLAGVCAVFFGVGGGIVVVPGLVLAVGGFVVTEAMATSLLAMVPTSAIGLRLAVRDQRVNASAVRTLLPAALLGSIGGVMLRNLALAPTQLSWLFGLFLLWVAFELFRRRKST
ncbi:MAG: sulfite exporter TauE/SafE family protein [Planctomycetes bacterium]|nr:sulfite exporter TauE/SafE family protein [Planctomycetota bacterium]